MVESDKAPKRSSLRRGGGIKILALNSDRHIRVVGTELLG
jgi:hypothetical protein